MARTYDYRYRLAAPGGHATCRVRVYREGEQTLAVVSWRGADWAAATPEDRTVALAATLAGWHHPRCDGRFLLIEQLAYPRGDGPGGARETFAVVDFGTSHALPRLRPIDRATVEGLIGEALPD